MTWDGVEQRQELPDTMTVIELKEQMSALMDKHTKLQEQVTANQTILTEIKDVLDTGRAAFKFFGAVGAFMKWVAVVAAGVAAAFGLAHIGAGKIK